MAYAPLPKLVPIGSPRVTSDEVTKAMFPEVLQLEPVKRLLNQPNIIIKPIKINPEDANGKSAKSKGKSREKRPKPDISVSLVNSSPEEEPQYLLSKTNGDSGISLHPIKRVKRKCGHSVPCENIVCTVNVHQHTNQNGCFPLVATYVTESDTNAPVSKHCENPLCDALSIDHNRCRRLKIDLNSIDKTAVCDICRITLKNRKTRIYHKNCRRKNLYQHNQVTGAQILKDRMRECEIQMMTALRMKRNDYIDPVSANENAIESLKNNSELIVIPQTPVSSSNESVITINTVSSPSVSQVTSVIPSIPFVLPSQSHSIIINNQNNLETPQISCKKLETLVAKTTSESMNQQNQYIVTTMPQTAIAYPLNANDFVLQGTGTPVAPKPMLMPVRVVPIANLKSEPSLLHQKQGIPKFCIVADNSLPMQPIVNVQTITPVQTVTVPSSISSNTSKPIPIMPNTGKLVKHVVVKTEGDNDKVPINKITPRTSKHRSRHSRKKKGDRKSFQCTHCSKCFSTDWYFKVHVAKHNGETLAKCEICETVFNNDSELRIHMTDEHHDKVQDKVYDDNDAVEFIEDVNELIICENCESTFETHGDMENHSCLEVNGDYSEDDEAVEVEVDIIVDNEDPEIVCTKVNGVMNTKNETPQEDNKKVGRRKSKQICRIDDEISEEHDLNFSAEQRRKRKSIHR